MENRIDFTNKIWIREARKTEWLVFIAAFVYVTLQGVSFMISGISISTIAMFIFAIILLMRYGGVVGKSGKYVDCACTLFFERNRIHWIYPKMPVKNTFMETKYDITADCVSDVAISHEIRSMRIVCRPRLCMVKNGRDQIVDYEKMQKDCILVLYYDNIDYLCALFREYMPIEFKIVD